MLNFVTKNTTRKAAEKEVAVRLNRAGAYSNGASRYNVAFRFYENAHKKICANSEYMVYAIDESTQRIYFKESNAIEGYKVSNTNFRNSEITSKTVSAAVSDIDFWNGCIGDYNLLYDRNEKLYYIEYSKK